MKIINKNHIFYDILMSIIVAISIFSYLYLAYYKLHIYIDIIIIGLTLLVCLAMYYNLYYLKINYPIYYELANNVIILHNIIKNRKFFLNNIKYIGYFEMNSLFISYFIIIHYNDDSFKILSETPYYILKYFQEKGINSKIFTINNLSQYLYKPHISKKEKKIIYQIIIEKRKEKITRDILKI